MSPPSADSAARTASTKPLCRPLTTWPARARADPILRSANASRSFAAATLPDSLAHTLSLFRERGRLPVYQEDTFDRDSWLAVLIGQGELPRRTDPLVEGVPAAESRAVMARRRQAVAAAASSRPTLAAWLGAQHRQLAR